MNLITKVFGEKGSKNLDDYIKQLVKEAQHREDK